MTHEQATENGEYCQVEDCPDCAAYVEEMRMLYGNGPRYVVSYRDDMIDAGRQLLLRDDV